MTPNYRLPSQPATRDETPSDHLATAAAADRSSNGPTGLTRAEIRQIVRDLIG